MARGQNVRKKAITYFFNSDCPAWGMEGLLGIHYAQTRSVACCGFCVRTSSMHTHYKVITIIMVDNAIIF
jgi:hypothetical protein